MVQLVRLHLLQLLAGERNELPSVRLGVDYHEYGEITLIREDQAASSHLIGGGTPESIRAALADLDSRSGGTNLSSPARAEW
jgi:hypothetical protein